MGFFKVLLSLKDFIWELAVGKNITFWEALKYHRKRLLLFCLVFMSLIFNYHLGLIGIKYVKVCKNVDCSLALKEQPQPIVQTISTPPPIASNPQTRYTPPPTHKVELVHQTPSKPKPKPKPEIETPKAIRQDHDARKSYYREHLEKLD